MLQSRSPCSRSRSCQALIGFLANARTFEQLLCSALSSSPPVRPSRAERRVVLCSPVRRRLFVARSLLTHLSAVSVYSSCSSKCLGLHSFQSCSHAPLVCSGGKAQGGGRFPDLSIPLSLPLLLHILVLAYLRTEQQSRPHERKQ